MASPEIVMGSSLLALFVNAGFAGQLGFWTIFVAHVMFCLSFVVVTVKARLSGLDPRLEQAAMDLYANEWQTFWRVTFPLVFPGILSAALLSFSLSFDDFIITNLNSGQDGHVPDVRLGRRPARDPAADQRDRHDHVPARPGPGARPATQRVPRTPRPVGAGRVTDPGGLAGGYLPRRWPTRGAAVPSVTTSASPTWASSGLKSQSPASVEHDAEDLLDLVEVLLVADQRRGQLDDRVAAVVGPAVEPGLEERLGQEAAQQPLGLVVVEGLLGALSLTSSMP